MLFPNHRIHFQGTTKMTHYEIVDAFLSHWMAIITIQFGFISATSAFVATGYLASKDLPTAVVRLLTALYSFIALFFTGITLQFGRASLTVRDQMHTEGLNWYVAASESQFLLPAAIFSSVVVMILLYLGAMWCFFQSRVGSPKDP
jgi:hypothetical protein